MKRKSYNILIVEDSLTQGEHLKYILESNEYGAKMARNGFEALEMVGESIPDLIISDVMMPGMNGFELCQAIKSNPLHAKIPFILLTSLADPKDIITGLESGADNFIPKPFKEDFLLSQIEYVLVNKDMREKSHIDAGMEIFFNGDKYSISSNRVQIVDLLLSTYQNAVSKSNELIEANKELSKLHDDLSAKNKQLEIANKEKNHFIGIVAHDLRNPLGNIISFADIVKEEIGERVDENTIKSLEIISQQATHLLTLVTELLGLCEIESGTITANKKMVSISNLIDHSIMTNQFLANKKHITIRKSLPSRDISIMIDQNKIEQVFNNLLSNAIKFSGQDTSVTVSLSEQPKGILIAVEDQGQGIPIKEQDLLFKPFSKTSVKGTMGEPSTGLGLFAVKKILDAHMGKIWVDSQQGTGSVFYFSLPYETVNQPVPDLKSPVIEKMHNWEDKLILIVDDTDSNYMFLAHSLLRTNANVIWAKNGQKAVDICKTNSKIDLVLMDIRMPTLDGYEASRQIREMRPDIVIIAQTAYNIEGEKERCLEAGCNSLLAYPIRADELLAEVARYFA
jgi:two-component system sensor histidine kinase/response regulator